MSATSLGPTRVRIDFNGSSFLGTPPQPLSGLLARMETDKLDPRMGAPGYMELAHGARSYIDQTTHERRYVDLGPIYPDAPDTVRFWGNFETYSHAFQVDTDDPEVIELLVAAIKRNKRRFP